MEKEGQKIQLKPLQAIKQVQNTLLQLKNKIFALQKQQNRTSSNIEKLFTLTIPIINKKIHESTQNTNMQKIRLSVHKQVKEKCSIARRHRLQQQQQIINSKAQLCQSKVSQSFHIKQISKKNQKVIAEGRRRVLEQKRIKRNQIKQQQQKSKVKIHQFHLYKKYAHKKQREEEEKIMLSKVSAKQKRINQLQQKQKQVGERAQMSKQMYSQLKAAFEYLYRIKADQFKQISQNLGIGANEQMLDGDVQRVLNAIEKKMHNSQQQQQRLVKRNDKAQYTLKPVTQLKNIR